MKAAIDVNIQIKTFMDRITCESMKAHKIFVMADKTCHDKLQKVIIKLQLLWNMSKPTPGIERNNYQGNSNYNRNIGSVNCMNRYGRGRNGGRGRGSGSGRGGRGFGNNNNFRGRGNNFGRNNDNYYISPQVLNSLSSRDRRFILEGRDKLKNNPNREKSNNEHTVASVSRNTDSDDNNNINMNDDNVSHNAVTVHHANTNASNCLVAIKIFKTIIEMHVLEQSLLLVDMFQRQRQHITLMMIILVVIGQRQIPEQTHLCR